MWNSYKLRNVAPQGDPTAKPPLEKIGKYKIPGLVNQPCARKEPDRKRNDIRCEEAISD
jgi:hypothetical protein